MTEPDPAGEVQVGAFYRFVPLAALPSLRETLLAGCREAGVRGTILLAPEGINGTLAGPEPAMAAARAVVEAVPGLRSLPWRLSRCARAPFRRLKVRLKREIVTLGVRGVDPARRSGVPVDPARWNATISDPGVTVLDTRNRYEVHLGRFAGALDPGTDSFRDFTGFVEAHLDPARHRRVAMYCTGGIRCAKASSWMLGQGFETVYQLDGGILRYLAETVPANSLWHGECFVFDERVALDHGLRPVDRELCPNCRMPIGPGEKALAEFEANVSCRHCFHRCTARRRSSLAERQRQQALAQGRRDGDAPP